MRGCVESSREQLGNYVRLKADVHIPSDLASVYQHGLRSGSKSYRLNEWNVRQPTRNQMANEKSEFLFRLSGYAYRRTAHTLHGLKSSEAFHSNNKFAQHRSGACWRLQFAQFQPPRILMPTIILFSSNFGPYPSLAAPHRANSA